MDAPASEPEESLPAAMLELGPLDQVPRGQGRCFQIGGAQIAVFRFRDDRLFAIDNVCPHRAGPLSAGVIGTDLATGTPAVVCPLHAYRFSLCDGRGLDTDMRVRVYPIEVRDGRILIQRD